MSRRSHPRVAAAVALALAALGLCGCGAARTQPPTGFAPSPVKGQRAVDVAQVGVSLTVPRNWADVAPSGPMVTGVQSRGAVLAVWRYGRPERLPQDAGELRDAQRALLRRIRARDASFSVTRARTREWAGAPAIEILGDETISGRRVRVRSVHVFALSSEVVVDAYAPAEHFARADTEVFEPALRSLRIRVAGT